MIEPTNRGDFAKGAPPKRLVIVGGGTAGWMTAAALAHCSSQANLEVVLIESEEIGTVGVGEATVPHIRFYNEKVGIDETEFMRRTSATYKLGIEFRDWARIGDSYIHPFGDYGRPIGGVPFFHHWLRARAKGHAVPLDDYSFPILLARMNRFTYPAKDPSLVHSSFGYAYQFDAGLYAAFLRAFSERGGVRRIEGKIVDVQRRGEDGFVESVRLDRGDVVTGDFFIDCSGFRGLLIEQTLQAGYEEWSRWLPCDRATVAPCASKESLTPYTRATALEAGWRWRIPLQHRVGNGYVHSSAFTTEDRALELFVQGLEAPPQQDPRTLRFTAGRRRKHWSKNVVAIGLSAGFIEPLESTSIYLIQAGIMALFDLFPLAGVDEALAREFNRKMDLEYERVRDFIILHYVATERQDSEFWRYITSMQIPDSLAEKMELFRERGIIKTYKDGMFLFPSWVAVYLGQRVFPRRFDPRALAFEQGKMDQTLSQLRDLLHRAAKATPDHEDFIRQQGQTYQTAA